MESRAVRTFGLAVFLASVGVHPLVGTGANSGDAGAPVVVGVWVAPAIAAGAVAFRD